MKDTKTDHHKLFLTRVRKNIQRIFLSLLYLFFFCWLNGILFFAGDALRAGAQCYICYYHDHAGCVLANRGQPGKVEVDWFSIWYQRRLWTASTDAERDGGESMRESVQRVCDAWFRCWCFVGLLARVLEILTGFCTIFFVRKKTPPNFFASLKTSSDSSKGAEVSIRLQIQESQDRTKTMGSNEIVTTAHGGSNSDSSCNSTRGQQSQHLLEVKKRIELG